MKEKNDHLKTYCVPVLPINPPIWFLPTSVPHAYLILLCSNCISSEKLRNPSKITQQVNGVVIEPWLSDYNALSSAQDAVLPAAPSERAWAGPALWEGGRFSQFLQRNQLLSTFLSQERKEEKAGLILPLFTSKGFCFALLFVPLILLALNTKVCSRPRWVSNNGFWCSKLKQWFLCLWEASLCL